jgi:hypothetical protein
MSLLMFLNLKPIDAVVFLVTSLMGYLIGTGLHAWWAPILGIMISYHLFLGWLVSTQDGDKGMSLSPVMVALTHLSSVVVVLLLSGASRAIHSSLLGLFKYGIASAAIFEAAWLFSGRTKAAVEHEEVAQARPVVTSTAADYELWLKLRAGKKLHTYETNVSLKDEYESWLMARARSAAVASADGNSPSAA